MNSNIVIVGVGQLGSRYLQGLVGMGKSTTIFAVDPFSLSLERAKERWIDVGGPESVHKVVWAASFDEVPEQVDIAIIATAADVRANVVADLVQRTVVRFWVLEKVLAQSKEEIVSIGKAVATAQGCWVNTPRRIMTWHCKLQEVISENAPLHIERDGGFWGLACNSIHFIDLMAWWTGEHVTSVDTAELESGWLMSKRDGFYEVTGSLGVNFSGGSSLRLSAYPDREDRGLKVESSAATWHIDEINGTAINDRGSLLPGNLEFQSAMTARLVSSILDKGTCALPTYEESAYMHKIFLDALLAHWNQTQNRDDRTVPIT